LSYKALSFYSTVTQIKFSALVSTFCIDNNAKIQNSYDKMIYMKRILHVEHSACTSQLCQIRDQVREACHSLSYNENDINLITLVIDEACTNIIRYAYCGEPGRIVLEIFQHSDEAIFHLQDFAKCIDKSCLALRKKNLLEPGGLGLQLIYQVMDSVELLPPQGATGNILELRKNLPKGSQE
jgi:anti-sigma regulatory factor (Ser/Thr protein kinase)